ncbi:right-handed parallel beta-helix repeat-containing protein (plasmid) [Phormidium sp. CLA17]|uniref:right-handed parallel beta-helix repeat-containing protein n=1 Tax=Leptolyngbya sp. Cla-17 TaxID=2803751 RepID=UPI0019332D40|nr:right-handed parallel beta-helix repeat-containing protein [Leptolyngbya sp. Cla-17]MBM0745369.1 right-handed parallel beta-helix repeat-containing protein [Leptolyngbya sp. Cla-17]
MNPENSLAKTSQPTFYVATNGNDTYDGSFTRPWATIHHAAAVLTTGQTVYIRGGIYPIAQQIQVHHSGTQAHPITYAAYPNEAVVINADQINILKSETPPFPHDQGAFQLENVSYITVKNLSIKNSHNSGFTIRNSHHITLKNNQTENSFSSGIGVWGSQGSVSHHIKILANTVINANNLKLGYVGAETGEAPHEAISLGTVEHFEVAYNQVQDSQKEGIDVKEASQHGQVHHNYVHHVKRQGLYVDSWFGVLEDVEVFQNVVHDCQGAGFVLSVESGISARNIRVHHNLLYDNWGTGILFGRWGEDGLRENIKIYHNTIYHNGYGKPNPGEEFYWITGGLYLFSNNLRSVEISRNIVSQNVGFQIGYSDRYLESNSNIHQVFQQKNIQVFQNLIHSPDNARSSIEAGWLPNDWATIYSFKGNKAIIGDPQFMDPTADNFYLKSYSPAIRNQTPLYLGAFPLSEQNRFWWQKNFPPQRTKGNGKEERMRE